MKRLSRDTWLTLAILAVLVIVTAFGAVRQAQGQQLPPFTSYSNAPSGVRAFNLWLEALSYNVRNITYENYRIPDETNLVLILQPSTTLTEAHMTLLDEWVEEGGTLVLAGDRTSTLFAAEHYGFELTFLSDVADSFSEQLPLFQSPLIGGVVTGPTATFWRTDRTDFITHLAVGSRPVVVSFAQGDGRVFLSATPYPFSNAGLKEAGNPEMVLNLVSAAGEGNNVWFDEWHHGIRASSTTISGPGEWLRYSPVGQAILYVVGIFFLAVVLNGRHFGKPKPLPREINRRTPLEYITAIANLNRRARHRANTMAQYRQWLKRDLGRRYRLDPTLLDESYVKQLGDYRPELDQAALLALLNRLSKKRLTEEEMITAAVEVSKWLEQ
ncbi:MAG: DUF4350 domain-containing protein [Candidatus Promineifilaceae bacterium]